MLLLLSVRIFGATITVTTTGDSGPGSLRAAIASAANGDTINFSLTLPTVIVLSTPITIGTSVTIAGPGTTLAISGGDSVGVLIVNTGATVAISNLTIEHGSSLLGGGISNGGTLTLTDVTVSFNTQGTQLGGGIFNSGALILSFCSVYGNSAGFGVASMSGETGFGGGIYNYGEGGGGKLTLINGSSVSGNSANQGLTGYPSGGAIYNDKGQVTLVNSLITNNTLNGPANNYVGDGGGIMNDGGTVNVTDSTISGNSADFGGGIYIKSGTATVTNSTFFGNIAGDDGGGIYSVYPGPLNVSFSTFVSNAAGVKGGGIDAGGLTLKNSILAENGEGNCASDSSFSSSTSDGYNLSDDVTCGFFFTAPGDFSNPVLNPRFDPSGLQFNGGQTLTVALQANSPAVNYIPLSSCTDTSGNPVTTDQRGVSRPQGSGCDVGAYELVEMAGTVPASGNECNGVFNGTFRGNIIVSNGQSCTFIGGGITGNVTQTGGKLVTRNATIGGKLEISGGGTSSIATTTIGGDFQIQNVPSGAAQNQNCGANVKDNLQFHNRCPDSGLIENPAHEEKRALPKTQ
jgi:hypothetical protein